VKHSRRKGFRLIRDRLACARKVPLRATRSEVGHGRAITWTLRAMPAPEWVVDTWPGSATIIAVRTTGVRSGKPVDESRIYVTSLRTCAKALMRHVRERWAIENSWHWVRDTQLREDAHRYREVNGVQILATLRTMGLNALRLVGMTSIAEGIAAVAHDIRALLRLLCWREATPEKE
jgi:hypothetical protein